jgi:hypothetical protein
LFDEEKKLGSKNLGTLSLKAKKYKSKGCPLQRNDSGKPIHIQAEIAIPRLI